MLTGELVPVDWHGLPVQVTNGPDRSSGLHNTRKKYVGLDFSALFDF